MLRSILLFKEINKTTQSYNEMLLSKLLQFLDNLNSLNYSSCKFIYDPVTRVGGHVEVQ